jgi:hypothetical protein
VSDKPNLKIGDSVWVYDSNHRVYPKDGRGGSPIYREYWRERFIVGETRVSWILGLRPDSSPNHGWSQKVPKNPREIDRVGIAYSPAELEAHCWMHDHRYRLMRKIEYCTDPALLKQIAEMVGYDESEAK